MPDARGSTVAAVATEDETIVLRSDEEAVVGRDPSSTIRIGHAPVYDDVVPRQACGIFSTRGRVVVSNLSSRIAFDVTVDDRPPMVVRPGDWFSPPHHRFGVVITGGAFSYALTITVNSVGARAELASTEAELSDSEPLTGAIPSSPSASATSSTRTPRRSVTGAALPPTRRSPTRSASPAP